MPAGEHGEHVFGGPGTAAGRRVPLTVEQPGDPPGVGSRPGQLPVAESWAAEELSLPMHPDLLPEELEYVVGGVRTAQSVQPPLSDAVQLQWPRRSHSGTIG